MRRLQSVERRGFRLRSYFAPQELCVAQASTADHGLNFSLGNSPHRIPNSVLAPPSADYLDRPKSFSRYVSLSQLLPHCELARLA